MSYTIDSNMTPEKALALAGKTARNKSSREHGVIITGDANEASLLCHAAKHVGLPIIGIAQGDSHRSVTRHDLDHAHDQWHSFMGGEQSFTLSVPTMFSNDRKESATDELDQLIGLRAVKSQMCDVIDFMEVKAKRERAGLPVITMGQHLVFTGNPGTGKTTVARLVGQIYKERGILEKGQFIETDGRGLIAEYLGQTAEKVRDIVKQAIGGVLFIDEAYALVPHEAHCDYGSEAIATLIKLMEDHRDELTVILAGYGDEMEQLLCSNPGLKSRFKTRICFPDYSAEELHQIFCKLCCNHAYRLSADADQKSQDLLKELHAGKHTHFGNGRAVRNAFERCLIKQASRLCKLKRTSKKDLQTLLLVDIPELSELSW